MREAIAELIGKHVAARRTERGKTQQQLGELVGISRQSISMIERGETTPGWDTFYVLALALRCEVFDLLPTCKQVQRLSEAHHNGR